MQADNKAFFASLATEGVNAESERLDEMSALEIAEVMNRANLEAVEAVKAAAPQIARAIDEIAARMRRGGRLFYLGAGTSGRLGVLDASECPPTFGVPGDLVVGVIAGGDGALRKAAEGAEDDPDAAAKTLAGFELRERDAVVAVSASGYAPYCEGALRYAREVGALSVAMSCNRNARISQGADIAIEAPTGAEVLSGSTRLKAGTATKLMLNALSTGAMVKLGKVYKNLMVDVRATNVKLRDRAKRIVMNATGLSREEADALYARAGENVKVAVVMREANASREAAENALAENGGVTRAAIRALNTR